MLQLRNATPFKANLFLLADAQGVETLFAVVKGTFAITPSLALADEQIPITLADEHFGDPLVTSIRRPSDVALAKPGTDVLLVGSAWSLDGPCWQMNVSLSVGPLTKTVRVFGDRVWRETAGGASIQWVAPFERMPLIWERAYGGRAETEQGPASEQRNPVGTGLHLAGQERALDGTSLPNVEDPAFLIGSPKDRPAPAGFAPVAPHWEPRKSYAGTYDAAWQKNRAPYYPTDLDARFFQVAPPGLVSARVLRGGEMVEVRGATPAGELRFALPPISLSAAYGLDHGTEMRAADLDTVVIEPDSNRVVMTWRAAFACDKKSLKIRHVSIAAARQSGGR